MSNCWNLIPLQTIYLFIISLTFQASECVFKISLQLGKAVSFLRKAQIPMELNSGSLVFSANTKDHKTPHVSVECLSQAVPGAAVSPSYLWRWGMLQIRLCLCTAERLSAPGSRCSGDYQWSKCRYELPCKWQSYRPSFLPILHVRLKTGVSEEAVVMWVHSQGRASIQPFPSASSRV